MFIFHHFEEVIISLRAMSDHLGGTVSELDKSQRKVHVQIAEATSTPEHTYCEKIHTPRRGSSIRPNATDAEWLELKHAHIDDDAASPAGFVERVQTPIATPNDRGFRNTIEEVESEVKEDEKVRAQETQRRNVQSLVTFVIGLGLGATAGVLLTKSSQRK
jgi:hypothetical protein